MARGRQNINSGFTVVEILVATGVIVIGLLGISSLVIRTLQAQTNNRYQLVASMLAQEGLELGRNIRDENWIIDGNGSNWSRDLIGQTNDDFIIDHNGRGSIDGSINNIDNGQLFIDSSGYYTHNSSGNPATPFFRLMEVTDNTDWLELKARVKWQLANKAYEYTATTYLYNWRY